MGGERVLGERVWRVSGIGERNLREELGRGTWERNWGEELGREELGRGFGERTWGNELWRGMWEGN